MQDVIIDEPYEFVPPVYGKFWPWVMHQYLKRYMRKAYGIHSIESRGAERLQASVDAGHGIIITPNHCRMSDPLTLGRSPASSSATCMRWPRGICLCRSRSSGSCCAAWGPLASTAKASTAKPSTPPSTSSSPASGRW